MDDDAQYNPKLEAGLYTLQDFTIVTWQSFRAS
jgi:hypothetical protein